MIFFKKYGAHILIGSLAGGVNGLLGAGGGIIVTYFLSHILTNEEKSENGVFACAVATMLPISIVSLTIYLLKGYLKINHSLLFLLPSAIIGGLIGAFLLSKLHLKAVKTVFSVLVIISGIMMIFK